MDIIQAQFDALTPDQHAEFMKKYAEKMVDNMDMKTMMQFVYDAIIENLSIQTSQDILNEVSQCYDDDDIQKMIDEVTA